MIPYFSTSVIIITIKLFSQQRILLENPVSWKSYLNMFYLPEAGYFLWFIWALWGMFLIVPLIKTTQLRTFLFIISILIGFIPMHLPEIFCIQQLVGMLKYFMLSVFLFEHKYWLEKVKKISFTIPCFLFFILFTVKQIVLNDFSSRIIVFLLPYIGIYAICLISIFIAKRNQFLSKALLVVSTSSYIIYLFHTTFEGFAKSTIHLFNLLIDSANNTGFAIGAVIVIVCGVVLPILMHHYILDKISILRFLFGLNNNKIKPAK